MVVLRCHNCPHTTDTGKDPAPAEWICSDCACVNVVPNYDPSSDSICDCLAPPSFQGWALPAGVHTDPLGNKIYITAQGSTLTRQQYIFQLGLDPETALAAMRKLGKEGVAGFYNTSTLGKKIR